VAESAKELSEDLPFSQLVRQLVDRVMAVTLNDQLWSLQTVVWVALPNHPRVQLLLKAQHEQWIACWALLYEKLAGRYGLELCPQYTWRDVAEVLHAVAEGARLRARVMGSAAALSSGDNVLAGAMHMLLPGLVLNPEAVTRTS
jgi:hypothetical protein